MQNPVRFVCLIRVLTNDGDTLSIGNFSVLALPNQFRPRMYLDAKAQCSVTTALGGARRLLYGVHMESKGLNVVTALALRAPTDDAQCNHAYIAFEINLIFSKESAVSSIVDDRMYP